MQSSDTNNPREDSVFHRVKAAVRKGAGPQSVVELLRQFRELEEEQQLRGETGISHRLFVGLLRDFGVRLRDDETAYICAAFDDKRDGYITSSTFVRHFIGLNARRHKAILRAWEVLPKNGRGEVAQDDMHDRYSLSGTRGDLSATFSSTPADQQRHKQGESGGKGVSLEEFIAFYAAVSAEILCDEQFELFLLREWDADAPTRPTMAETQREWGPDGDPLAITKPLFVQDALNMALGTSSRNYNYSHMQRVHPYVEPLPPLERDYLSVTKCDFRPYVAGERVAANTLRHR
ncbi:hypothetical protein DQ04_03061020 [Trypanosoma grayi]|uniref:hypothetical protein n=1 Tax=Trypanosoma grayi TaxID=71804 RepID=UPI0004F45FFE|nr:hypothetical protein DQ04_03061020 [Trypanosoma grayi]KEG11007.1 hypothetical protein DQ04_03061020 [Trypanosoma grayi]